MLYKSRGNKIEKKIHKDKGMNKPEKNGNQATYVELVHGAKKKLQEKLENL